jgi:nucleotide-binding universal stress UspA family protein
MLPIGSITSQELNIKLKKILVPVNGGTADRDVINLACDLARKNKASIYVIYIIEVKRSLPLDALIQADLTKAEQILNQAEELASEQDFEIKTDLIQSREAGAAIVDEAIEKDIDLIIMGIEYKKRFGRFSTGGAVSHVLEEAPCRIIILRRPIPGGGE